MKMIIKGKKYDTETATLIGHWSNGLYATDFNYLYEVLYKKKTGEFFINQVSYSDVTIVPLSLEEAKEWVENHANEKYEELFGECEE